MKLGLSLKKRVILYLGLLAILIGLIFSGCAVPPGGPSSISGGGGGGTITSIPKLWDVATYKLGGSGGNVGIVGSSNTFFLVNPSLTVTDFSDNFKGTPLEGFDILSLDFYTDSALFMLLYDSATGKSAIANVIIGAGMVIQSTEHSGTDKLLLKDALGNDISLSGMLPAKVRTAVSSGGINYAAAALSYNSGGGGTNTIIPICNTTQPLYWQAANIDLDGNVYNYLVGKVMDLEWLSGAGTHRLAVVLQSGIVYVFNFSVQDGIFKLTKDKEINLGTTLYGIAGNFNSTTKDVVYPLVAVGDAEIAVIYNTGAYDEISLPATLSNVRFIDVSVVSDNAVIVGYDVGTNKPVAVLLNIPSQSLTISTLDPEVANYLPMGVTFLSGVSQYIWMVTQSISSDSGIVYYSADGGKNFKELNP